MNPWWLVRMARMARHPPKLWQVKVMVVVVVASLAIAGVERVWGWPDWARVNGGSRVYKP